MRRTRSPISSPRRISARARADRARSTPRSPMNTPAKTNLLGLTRSELDAFVAGMGEKPFRAQQLMKWVYKRHVSDFDQMTDLAKSFRERLKEVAEVRTPEITLTQASADGTRKWLLAMGEAQG